MVGRGRAQHRLDRIGRVVVARIQRAALGPLVGGTVVAVAWIIALTVFS